MGWKWSVRVSDNTYLKMLMLQKIRKNKDASHK